MTYWELLKSKIDFEKIKAKFDKGQKHMEAERLKADILSQFDCLEFYITDFTPVIGTHTGPGTIGLSFYAADST